MTESYPVGGLRYVSADADMSGARHTHLCQVRLVCVELLGVA